MLFLLLPWPLADIEVPRAEDDYSQDFSAGVPAPIFLHQFFPGILLGRITVYWIHRAQTDIAGIDLQVRCQVCRFYHYAVVVLGTKDDLFPALWPLRGLQPHHGPEPDLVACSPRCCDL